MLSRAKLDRIRVRSSNKQAKHIVLMFRERSWELSHHFMAFPRLSWHFSVTAMSPSWDFHVPSMELPRHFHGLSWASIVLHAPYRAITASWELARQFRESFHESYRGVCYVTALAQQHHGDSHSTSMWYCHGTAMVMTQAWNRMGRDAMKCCDTSMGCHGAP